MCKYLLKEVSPEDSSKGSEGSGTGKVGKLGRMPGQAGATEGRGSLQGSPGEQICVRVVPT